MKFELKRGKNYLNLGVAIDFPFSKSFRFSTTFYDTPSAYTLGYNNRCADGSYVIFCDYDDLALNEIVAELQFIQEKFALSDFYIFKLDRENSWHAVCLDKVTLAQCWEILHVTSCDGAFVNSVKNLNTRKWVLRIDKKGGRNAPKFELTIHSPFQSKTKSNAHAEFLKRYWGVPIEKTGKFDSAKEIGIIRYNTASRVKSKV